MAEIIINKRIAEAHGVECADWLDLNTETGIAVSVADLDRFGVKFGEPVQLSPETCISMMQARQAEAVAEADRLKKANDRKAAFMAATCPNCGMTNFNCGGGCHE